MWRRIELHNHTLESDGIMTPDQLVHVLHDQGVTNFSLTDHNTISGWAKLEEPCRTLCMNAMHGMEITSWYGHMLVQNLSAFPEWEDLRKDDADFLFQRIHEMGAIAGPAHPCAIPAPFSSGMRWSMIIHDWNLPDFIEVINYAHPMIPDNRDAIRLWKEKILGGYRIAPVSGLDLHRPIDFSDAYQTWFDGSEDLPLGDSFQNAVKGGRVQVTNGPLLNWKGRTISLVQKDQEEPYLLEVLSSSGRSQYQLFSEPVRIESSGFPAALFLYRAHPVLKDLCVIAAVF
ncbi:MAG: CehA/McbA family metallohydrolase [Bulleidia sp.]